MGIGQIQPGYGVPALCGNDNYSVSHLAMNWHPSAGGSHLWSDVLAYWLLSTAIQYLDANNGKLLKASDFKQLNQVLIDDAGNWQHEMLKDIPNWPPKAAQTSQTVYCAPFCQTVPFTIYSWRPITWNTASRFNDYLIADNNLHLYNKTTQKYSLFDDTILQDKNGFNSLSQTFGNKWKWEYFGIWNLKQNTGWRISGKLEPAFDLMQGDLHSMDNKPGFTADELQHQTLFREFLTTSDAIDHVSINITSKVDNRMLARQYGNMTQFLEPFSEYLKATHHSLSFFMKIPRNGNHSLMIDFLLKRGVIETFQKSFKIWLTPLILYDNKKNIDLNKNTSSSNFRLDSPYKSFEILQTQGCDKSLVPGCHLHEIVPGKYLINIVVANMTGDAFRQVFDIFSGY